MRAVPLGVLFASLLVNGCGGGGGGGAANHAPTATGGGRAVHAGTNGALAPWVEDVDLREAFSLQLLGTPSSGTASVSGHRWTYTPGASFTSGTDSFSYRASDGAGGTVDGSAKVRVYDDTALAACRAVSTVNTDGTLASRTRANSCAFYGVATVRTPAVGAAVTMDYLANWPSDGTAPKALVVLVGGGNLDMAITGDANIGVADQTGGGNFVIRAAQLLADAGYLAVAIDRPSDQPPAGSTDSIADADHYRVSVAHAVDILTLLEHVQGDPLDLFLVGTSRGAISAVAANLIAAGISLSSSVTSSDANPDRLYVGRADIPTLLPASVERPAHVLWHEKDLCLVSTPAASQVLATSLGAATSVVSGGVRVRTAGNNVTPDVCGAFDYHGYLGIEPTAMATVTSWLDGRVAALAGNHRPRAAFATFSTGAGSPLQIDLSLLARDQDGDALSYSLSHAATLLGGSVTLAGATATYSPPSGTSHATDAFVYVVTDGKGGVGAAVVSVLVGG
jgi:hypothetical protein